MPKDNQLSDNEISLEAFLEGLKKIKVVIINPEGKKEKFFGSIELFFEHSGIVRAKTHRSFLITEG